MGNREGYHWPIWPPPGGGTGGLTGDGGTEIIKGMISGEERSGCTEGTGLDIKDKGI